MTIDERRLDELLADATRTYRVPPEPALETIWQRVSAEAFAAPARQSRPDWIVYAATVAAALVIGVIGGRSSLRLGATANGLSVATGVTAASGSTDPYHRTTQEFLGRTAVLLTSFPASQNNGTTDARLIEQASQLLVTTRLLLDSPVGQDRRMKGLLQDLELVLAQVARLRESGRQDEISLITESMEEHDVLPRLRTAVSGLSISDY